MDMKALADEIIGGRRITRQDDLNMFLTCDLKELCEGAYRFSIVTSGRTLLTNDGEIAFQSGASATITGNMLTKVACATIRSDKQMLENLGRDVTPDYIKAED